MTPCPWERTLGKVTMQTGVLIHCQLSSHLLPLHLYLCLLPFFLIFLDYRPCKPFLIFLSVINLYLPDSLLLYPAHIFFHLPSPSPALFYGASHRMLKTQWAGYKNMKSTSEKEELNTLLFQPHWPCSHISFFFSNSLISATSCRQTSDL